MTYLLRMLLIVLFIASALAGCGQKPPPQAIEAPPDIYSLEVRSESGSSSTAGLPAKADVTLGGFRVQVENGQMTVNGKNYGKLQPDDKVLIEKDGQVLVNANVREPW
jgi:predicted small lipoprotein YifL